LSYFTEITNNLPDIDPLFVDEAHLDLRLRPESPALAIPAFPGIPFRRIGIEGHGSHRAIFDEGSASEER